MKAAELRASILQEAVSGKLVPQIASEGTADELLKQIEAERAALIKAGKIKKEKPLPEITEDEIPFEIPKSWKWVRLGKIVYNTGQKIPTKRFSYIDIGSIDNIHQKLNSEEQLIEAKDAPSRARKIVSFGDIIYATVRPYLHNTCIIDKSFTEEPIASTGFAVLTCNSGVYNRYLFSYLLSPEFDNYANSTDNAKGMAYPAINDEALYKGLIPLPPLSEQKRIVAKLEEILPLIDQYGEEEEKLSALSAQFPEAMRKSILQEAVSGKLVPQIASEGTADELLKQIEAERAALIKAGKLKKEKPLPEITEDEIPFEIPKSWKWVRIGDISNFGTNTTVEPNEISDSSWVLELEDIQKDTGIILKKIVKSERVSTSTKHQFKAGHVLYSKLRPYLNKVLVADADGFCTSEIHVLDFGKYIYPKYAKICLQSPSFLAYVNSCSYGVKMPRLGTADGVKALFPLPPLSEQKRIVAKIEELMSIIDGLKA